MMLEDMLIALAHLILLPFVVFELALAYLVSIVLGLGPEALPCCL